MDNRFYLQALGVTGLFISLLLVFWVASGGPASEAEVRNASSTRTTIAMTASFLMQPRTRTPAPFIIIPTSQTGATASTSTGPSMPATTNTPVPPQPSTPIASIAPSSTPLPTQTAIAQVPAITTTGIQDPAEFARWYFARVWKERDYQNLWDNYLTASFKANVGSGLFEDYVGWWNSVERVDVHSVDVLENNGTDAWVRVNLTFRMKDRRVVRDQIYDYDFLYDATRGTWMFDSSP